MAASENETANEPAQGPPGDGAGEPMNADEPNLVDEAMTALFDGWLSWLSDYPWAQTLLALTLLLMVAWLAHLLVRRYLIRGIGALMGRVPSWWVRVVREQKVFHRLVPLVPTIIIGQGVEFVPHLPGVVTESVQRVAQATVVLVVALAFGAVLNTIHEIYNRYPIARGRPIKGYLQVVKVVAYVAAGILIVAALMAESPVIFLSGLGAMMAIIMLIFRDTLLSLVAGIQLVNNDLVRVGDWIEMPQFDADGDVIDIQLNVIRVLNFDKTITAIPTHKFLEHSFKNWRGMHETGGRRIKRAVHVDLTTIRFLTQEEIDRFRRFRLLKDYIDEKTEALTAYNREHCPEDAADVTANGRHLTNVGTFRAYIDAYIRQHPMVHQEMTCLVRQLEPGPHGLPIELYHYIKDTHWPVYEGAQADIFDHIFAVASEFGLRLFQEPTGHDLAQLRRPARSTEGNGRADSSAETHAQA
ncbi:MAG: mechanosensitive ion channel family protein [Phycisphaeraceae bacterium]